MRSVCKDGMVRHNMVRSITHNCLLTQVRLTLLKEWLDPNHYFDKANCEDFQKDGLNRMYLKCPGFAHVSEVLSVIPLVDTKGVLFHMTIHKTSNERELCKFHHTTLLRTGCRKWYGDEV